MDDVQAMRAWRPLPGTRYEVSRTGLLRHRTADGRTLYLKPSRRNRCPGYSIRINGRPADISVNRLVSMAWPERAFQAGRTWFETTLKRLARPGVRMKAGVREKLPTCDAGGNLPYDAEIQADPDFLPNPGAQRDFGMPDDEVDFNDANHAPLR